VKVCNDCETARARIWHGYRAACPDCIVRQLAMSPRHIREAAYEHALKNVGSDASNEIKRRVKEEGARIRALRENQSTRRKP
jgi:hypothetical protein